MKKPKYNIGEELFYYILEENSYYNIIIKKITVSSIRIVGVNGYLKFTYDEIEEEKLYKDINNLYDDLYNDIFKNFLW